MLNLIGCYKIWVLFSYIGIVFSALAAYFTINNHYKIGILFLMFAGIIDIFDGKVARKFKRDKKQEQFGIEIDSIIDTVNFGVLPIIIYYNLVFCRWYDYIIMFLYLFAVTMRLAYFNAYLIEQKDIGKNYELYIGFPVTSIALIIPFFYVIQLFFNNEIIMRIGFLISILLFILKIKVKRYKAIAFNVGLIVFGVILIILMMLV